MAFKGRLKQQRKNGESKQFLGTKLSEKKLEIYSILKMMELSMLLNLHENMN